MSGSCSSRSPWRRPAAGAPAGGSPSSPVPARTTPRPRSRPRVGQPTLGADAALVVTPYYNRPDQRMLEAHYRAIADDGALPIVVYNVPSRTGSNVDAATLLRLAEHPRIVAVKEASANLDQIMTILRDRPAASRSSRATTPGRSRCWRSVATASSRSRPTRSRPRWRACARWRGRATGPTARALHERLLDLFRVNFISPNPVPVKAALAEMGLIADVLRQPLLPLADEGRAAPPARARRRRPAPGDADRPVDPGGGVMSVAAAEIQAASTIELLRRRLEELGNAGRQSGPSSLTPGCVTRRGAPCPS